MSKDTSTVYDWPLTSATVVWAFTVVWPCYTCLMTQQPLGRFNIGVSCSLTHCEVPICSGKQPHNGRITTKHSLPNSPWIWICDMLLYICVDSLYLVVTIIQASLQKLCCEEQAWSITCKVHPTLYFIVQHPDIESARTAGDTFISLCHFWNNSLVWCTSGVLCDSYLYNFLYCLW